MSVCSKPIKLEVPRGIEFGVLFQVADYSVYEKN